jgi:hypothetical protein
MSIDFFKRPPASDFKAVAPCTIILSTCMDRDTYVTRWVLVIACRAWTLAQDVVKYLAISPIYLDPRYDKCWCHECIPNAPNTQFNSNQDLASVPGGLPSGGYGGTGAEEPAYKITGIGDQQQRYTLPYGYVQLGLRVEPRYRGGRPIKVWDEWNNCYYGLQCSGIEAARATLTSVLTGSLARPGQSSLLLFSSSHTWLTGLAFRIIICAI